MKLHNLELTVLAGLIAGMAFATRSGLSAEETKSYPPVNFPDVSGWGRNIQRTMRLLATSTPEKRNTVRILFYGQSITEQNWAKLVEDDLRRRFPHANLIIENRALGRLRLADARAARRRRTCIHFSPTCSSFTSMARTTSMRTSFAACGSGQRRRSCMQNDHVTKSADLAEETDPAKAATQRGKHGMPS